MKQFSPPRNPSKHPDRAASNFGLVNPSELLVKRSTPQEQIQALERAKLYNHVFVHLPGNPPQHKVVGIVQHEQAARVRDVEQIYNDMLWCDYCMGRGYYKLVAPDIEKELLELAERLYRQ